MKSKFAGMAILPVFIIAVLTCAIPFSIFAMVMANEFSILVILIPAILFSAFTLTWLIYGELRVKVISVEVEFDHLIIRRYLGVSPPVTIYYAELDGYTISILPATSRAYEYLNLVQKGKKVAKLSEFYHRNYAEISKEIETKIKDLGVEDFSYLQEVKEIFI